MYNYKKSYKESINEIIKVLTEAQLYHIINDDPSVYVGGSFPSFIVSQKLDGKLIEHVECNDIDLYTSNYVQTLYNLSKALGNKITNVKRTGVNITLTIDGCNIPIQLITSEFESFYDDVLGNYDCTMVAIGFYPFDNELIVHDRFNKDYAKKEFTVYYERSNEKRIKKLSYRAKEWYSATIKVIKETDNADFRPYYKKSVDITYLQDIVSPPNYVQLYYNKYKCVKCAEYNDYLLCQKCSLRIMMMLTSCNNTTKKKITILGGVNGLGKIIAEVATSLENDVYVTSRNPNNNNRKEYQFSLNNPTSNELMDHLLTSDIIILNAYSTLENDEKIWLTTLDTFDEALALDKFRTNTFGYVRFLQEFIKKRKEQIKNTGLKNDIKLVFMDANESKFINKLSDGKHLELNLAKTATKQIFYTNANLLASLGILTICYDPGWLSYHGISVDKIESKSQYLIPPKISVLGLLYDLGTHDVGKYISEKKFIFDCSIYGIINSI